MRASLNGMLVVVVGTDAPADYGRQLAEGAQAAFACWLSALSQFAIPENGDLCPGLPNDCAACSCTLPPVHGHLAAIRVPYAIGSLTRGSCDENKGTSLRDLDCSATWA